METDTNVDAMKAIKTIIQADASRANRIPTTIPPHRFIHTNQSNLRFLPAMNPPEKLPITAPMPIKASPGAVLASSQP